MTLVKIGQTIFNFDRVTLVRDLSTATMVGPVLLEFGKGHTVQIHEQAGTLKAWLDANIITPANPQPSPGPEQPPLG